MRVGFRTNEESCEYQGTYLLTQVKFIDAFLLFRCVGDSERESFKKGSISY